jgi:hypothetical protein
MKTAERPVAGVDTPAADDVITQCAAGCGGWTVRRHPSHTTAVEIVNPATGKVAKGKPTPAWVEATVERMESRGSRCRGCGAGPSLTDKQRAEIRAAGVRVASLLDFDGEAV